MSTIIFFVLHKSIKKEDPRFLEDGVDRYISVTFSQTDENWHVDDITDNEAIFKRKKFPAVQCTKDHFGNTTRSLQLFNAWKGFSLFCLDTPYMNQIKFFNEHGEMINKHFTMRVERCENTTTNGNFCHSPERISEYIEDASVHGWVIQDNVVMREELEHPPRYQTQRLWMQSLLSAHKVDKFNTYLSKIEYVTYDSLLGTGAHSKQGSFFQVHSITNRPQIAQKESQLLMEANFYLSPFLKNYVRKTYNLSNAVSKLGGLMSVMMAVFKAVLFPISQHMYYWIAIKRLFLARTSDQNLFLDEKKGKFRSRNEKKITQYFNPEQFGIQNMLLCRVKNEIQKHRLIRISLKDSILLFLHDRLVCLQWFSCWKKKAQFQKLFKEGKLRIEKDLNIIKLVRNLKRLKILMKSSLMTKQVKFQIAHNIKNCIDLDDT